MRIDHIKDRKIVVVVVIIILAVFYLFFSKKIPGKQVTTENMSEMKFVF